MAPFPFDIVGFDLDGTLLDTAADLAAATNAALAADGRAPLSVAQVRGMIGAGGRQMLEQALAATGGGEPALVERLMLVLEDHYARHVADHSRPFPDAVAALDALAAAGVRLAVVTNKRERFTLPLLRAVGLADRFACIIGGDTLGVTKPLPEPIRAMIARCGGGRAAFVGDSIFDIQAGRAAGIPTIAAGFGFLQQPAGTIGADAVIDDFGELVPALLRLG